MADSALAESAPPVARPTDLDRSSPLPLYAQVKRRMQAMITTGERPADRFYSEQELCAMFAISRATVRQAVQELVAEGWLRRVQGQGTFVNRDKVDEAFGPTMNFLDQWAQVGRPLSYELRRFAIEPCPPAFAHQLGLQPEAAALCLERARIRHSESLVIAYDYRYIHPDCAHLVDRDAAARGSLLDLLARGVRLSSGENRLEAGLAGRTGAALLDVPVSAPVLIREMTYFDTDGSPVMAGRSYYRADQVRCAFKVSLQPGSPDSFGPAPAPLLATRAGGHGVSA